MITDLLPDFQKLVLKNTKVYDIFDFPDKLKGQEVSCAMQRFKKFHQGKKYNLQFHFHDERYSSQAANDLYQKDYEPSGRKNKKQDWDRDSVAAMLILEAWFESGYLNL